MFEAFYSLKQRPFCKEISPVALYPCESACETKSRLEYLKQIRGIGVITGEPGSGKSTQLRAFAEGLNPSLYKVMYFPLSTGTVMDFYRGIAGCLGETPRFRKVELFHQIQEAIRQSFQEDRITPVIILDEMHLTRPRFLSEITILFNFAMDSKNPFILILSGLDYLSERLQLNQNRPLNQRIVMRYKLEALSEDECKGYIQHQLKLAGANTPIFEESALNAIAQRTRGIPRLINNVCTDALITGAANQAHRISDEIVYQACEALSF